MLGGYTDREDDDSWIEVQPATFKTNGIESEYRIPSTPKMYYGATPFDQYASSQLSGTS